MFVDESTNLSVLIIRNTNIFKFIREQSHIFPFTFVIGPSGPGPMCGMLGSCAGHAVRAEGLWSILRESIVGERRILTSLGAPTP